MANTLNDLIPDAYAAIDQVSRELTGLIPAVTMDASFDRAAEGVAVRVPIVPANTAGFDITPSMALGDAADQTIGNVDVVINKSRGRPFSWNGNEQVGLNRGPGYQTIRVNQIAQAIRGLVNEMETDLAALQSGFSRAYGTPGATPFATSGDFTDASEVLRILKDNGAPPSFDNHLVMNTAAGAKFIGKQAEAHRQGSDSILRQGVLLDVSGMSLRESAQIVTHIAGDAASATTNAAVYAVGATVITLASAGTGAILPGDVITLANDSQKYVVVSGDASVAGGGTITIAEPGLRKATSGSATNITVVATSARNMAFNRNAIVLATRLPQRPEEGDLAIDVEVITDPRTGMTFEIAVYPGKRMVRYEVGISWGVRLIKPEWTALLLG
jgi:hypothetical protein